jgi:hypothetical protein
MILNQTDALPIALTVCIKGFIYDQKMIIPPLDKCYKENEREKSISPCEDIWAKQLSISQSVQRSTHLMI